MGRRPNIIVIVSDDHASHAIGAYGSRINETPHIDRLAQTGMRFDSCLCTNSICTPSRAAMLTGTYNHVNGVTTLDTPMDNTLRTFPKLLRAEGYQTAIYGKWHLGHGAGHDPTGFDAWRVLRDQGEYHDPEFLGPDGAAVVKGYVTDIITDLAIEWIRARDPERPFMVMVHHKAPHRSWEPDEAHASLYRDVDIAEPETFRDDYATRSAAAEAARCQMMDLGEADLKEPVPAGLTPDEEISWRYQRYIKDYLRCVASIDDNVGRLLDHLEAELLAGETVVVYSSDQGFFLGDHGWFDKRFMYEESLSMPLLVRAPGMAAPGSVSTEMVLNVDFAPTLCELAGVEPPGWMQGTSAVPLLRGETPPDWQQSMYYRYWMHRDSAHDVWAHYGVRTHTHKLIHFYADPLGQPGANGPADPPQWELYDLEADPYEVNNVIDDPAYRAIRRELETELARLQAALGDEPYPAPAAPTT
ncbi:MAG: sulfatase [Acidimicrobiales bacterium]